jgi:methyl-accepting chemotaxis protein
MESRGIYMSEDKSANLPRYVEGVNTFLSQIRQKLDAWSKNTNNEISLELKKIEPILEDFIAFRLEMNKIAISESTKAARVLGDNEKNRNNRKQLNDKLVELTKLFDEREEKLNFEVAEIIRKNAYLSLIMNLTIIVLTLAGVTFAFITIAKPMKQLETATLSLADGDLDIEVPCKKRNDEIGRLARSIESFKLNAQSILALTAEKNTTHIAESERKSMIKKMADDCEATVGVVVNEVMKSVFDMRSQADTVNMNAIEASQKSLHLEIVAEKTANNVQSVAAASNQIATSIVEISKQIEYSVKMTNNVLHLAQKSANDFQNLDDLIGNISNIFRESSLKIELTFCYP